MSAAHVAIAGGGVFGLASALELCARGLAVTVVEPGPIPAPLAASTDVSKVVRMEYGPDELYMALMEEARKGWLAWNDAWRARSLDPLYHETGVLMVARDWMGPGGFEHESFELLVRRGHAPERLGAEEIARRFPAWSTGAYVDGFFHARGGFAESGRVVERLAAEARERGATLVEGRRVERLLEEGARVVGLVDSAGDEHRAGHVVVATGAWISKLVPELERAIVPSGHPVFHLRPRDPALFRSNVFPTFTADVSRTGYYGFPVNREGIVKIANHGVGVDVDADAARAITPEHVASLRSFLESTFPALADAEIVYTRLCLYDDTENEDLWIDRHPDRPGLVVAGGGSGHAFKFAPLIGSWVADAIEGRERPWRRKFGWRPVHGVREGREAARCHHPTR